MARAEDGEAFAILTNNDQLDSAVKLDLRLIEADQVATPDRGILNVNSVDGIVFDAAGNPTEYHVLRYHPGDVKPLCDLTYDRIPARSVIHFFRSDRPGQSRGIPDITPALPLFAQLRRFTLAVLAAAETAADFAGILYSDAPAKQSRRIVAIYDYRDADGKLLYQVVRYEPKTFKQRRRDGHGGWVWNLKGVSRVLYRLPELVAADPARTVYVAEGEKDVGALESIGLIATCNPQGANKWSKLSDDSVLHGRRVVIIQDKDDAGRKHALDVASRLHGRAAEVRIVEPPDNYKDPAEWIETRDALKRLKWRETLNTRGPLIRDRDEIGKKIAKADKVLEEAERKHEEMVQPFVSRLFSIKQGLRDADEAEQRLRDTSQDKAVLTEIADVSRRANDASKRRSELEDEIRSLRSWSESDAVGAEQAPYPGHAEELRERSEQRKQRADSLQPKLAEVETTLADLRQREQSLRERLLQP
jgi:hypothetical protein